MPKAYPDTEHMEMKGRHQPRQTEELLALCSSISGYGGRRGFLTTGNPKAAALQKMEPQRKLRAQRKEREKQGGSLSVLQARKSWNSFPDNVTDIVVSLSFSRI